jgi:endogenous inhibitor of DNA gyrase (YacG/DUF329 family)
MRRVRCPTCRREVAWEGNRFRPFCSDRCRLLDLAAWADERYRVPGDPLPEPESEGDGAPRGDGRAIPEARLAGRPSR